MNAGRSLVGECQIDGIGMAVDFYDASIADLLALELVAPRYTIASQQY